MHPARSKSENRLPGSHHQEVAHKDHLVDLTEKELEELRDVAIEAGFFVKGTSNSEMIEALKACLYEEHTETQML